MELIPAPKRDGDVVEQAIVDLEEQYVGSAVQASLQLYGLHFGNPEISQPYRLHNRGFH
jgi:hypothetical protein